jgi:phosphomannomutase
LLAGLLLMDYVAKTGKTPSQLLNEVFAITGPHYYERLDFELEPGANATVKAKLDGAHPTELAGRPVLRDDRVDGWRFFVDQGWLLFRLSGTEPLLRIYTEVRDEALVKPMLEAGKALAGYTE